MLFFEVYCIDSVGKNVKQTPGNFETPGQRNFGLSTPTIKHKHTYMCAPMQYRLGWTHAVHAAVDLRY